MGDDSGSEISELESSVVDGMEVEDDYGDVAGGRGRKGKDFRLGGSPDRAVRKFLCFFV